jgi:hypothetical protein
VEIPNHIQPKQKISWVSQRWMSSTYTIEIFSQPEEISVGVEDQRGSECLNPQAVACAGGQMSSPSI